jgi:uncharacterized membrane protein YccC
MRLSDQSANTLVSFALLLLVPGVLVPSPTGRFFFLALAALIALVPLIFGSVKRRVFAGLVFGISLLIGTATYPDFRKDYDPYLERARAEGGSRSTQSAPPVAPTR